MSRDASYLVQVSRNVVLIVLVLWHSVKLNAVVCKIQLYHLLLNYMHTEKFTEISLHVLPHLLPVPPLRAKKQPKLSPEAVEKMFFFEVKVKSRELNRYQGNVHDVNKCNYTSHHSFKHRSKTCRAMWSATVSSRHLERAWVNAAE